MKIAISTSKGGLEDEVNPVFGRCQTFTIVEADNSEIKSVEVISNPGHSSGGGAGIVASQNIVNLGAKAVITGNCGPNAMNVLSQAGIKLYNSSGNVKKAVEDLLNGKLNESGSATVGQNFGKGGSGSGAGRGGFGQGRGMGRGF